MYVLVSFNKNYCCSKINNLSFKLSWNSITFLVLFSHSVIGIIQSIFHTLMADKFLRVANILFYLINLIK